jgi:hypothetical protein
MSSHSSNTQVNMEQVVISPPSVVNMDQIVISPAPVVSAVVVPPVKPVMVHQKTWKEKKSAKAEAIFDDSTHQWLFSRDVTCTEKLLGYFAVIIQILSYAMLVTMAQETAKTHDKSMCFSYSGSTFVALFVFGYLLRDMIGLFSVGCLNICATFIVIIELMCAIATVVIADVFAEDEFAAVSAGIGVLFVHDLDEQIYGALGKIKKNSRKFVAFALWIILAGIVGVAAHKQGCGEDLESTG